MEFNGENYPVSTGIVLEDVPAGEIYQNNPITVKVKLIPFRALRQIEVKISLMRCRCWGFGKHKRRWFYFSTRKNRYYMRNSHGKEEEWFDY